MPHFLQDGSVGVSGQLIACSNPCWHGIEKTLSKPSQTTRRCHARTEESARKFVISASFYRSRKGDTRFLPKFAYPPLEDIYFVSAIFLFEDKKILERWNTYTG